MILTAPPPAHQMYDADRGKVGEPVQLDMSQLPELVSESPSLNPTSP